MLPDACPLNKTDTPQLSCVLSQISDILSTLYNLLFCQASQWSVIYLNILCHISSIKCLKQLDFCCIFWVVQCSNPEEPGTLFKVAVHCSVTWVISFRRQSERENRQMSNWTQCVKVVIHFLHTCSAHVCFQAQRLFSLQYFLFSNV